MADAFRTFDLSDLSDPELHSYHLGISFAIINLQKLRGVADSDFDAAIESEKQGDLNIAMGEVTSLAQMAHVLDGEHFAILQDKAKRQEENVDG